MTATADNPLLRSAIQRIYSDMKVIEDIICSDNDRIQRLNDIIKDVAREFDLSVAAICNTKIKGDAAAARRALAYVAYKHGIHTEIIANITGLAISGVKETLHKAKQQYGARSYEEFTEQINKIYKADED